MQTSEVDKEISRLSKEFVYEQWRKLLCFYVVEDDISINQFDLKNVTPEKIRTIFNNGYKFAMLQTKQTLIRKMFQSSDLAESKIIEQLINEIDDRVQTSKCLVAYEKNLDVKLYENAVEREAGFSKFLNDDFTRWTTKQM